MTAGNYRLTVNSYVGYGDVNGGFNMQFRPGNDRCTFARLVTNGTFNGCPAPVNCFVPTLVDGQEWFPVVNR